MESNNNRKKIQDALANSLRNKPKLKKFMEEVQKRTAAPKKIKKQTISRNQIHGSFGHSCFITGGIGDVLAVESFMTQQEKERLQTIFYATNKHEHIEFLFKKNKSFKNLTNHVVVWDDFSKFWCFHSMLQYQHKSSSVNNKVFSFCHDLSISKIFPEVKQGNLKYQGSSFIQQKLTEIDHLELPKKYITILPYSTDKRQASRDFEEKDWNNVICCLEQNNIKGVVVNKGEDKIPDHELIINMSNKTKLDEAIEILKNSKGFLGIDSWLSVLASKIFNPPYIQVKSQNGNCYDNATCYYAPLTDFSFIKENIQIQNTIKVL
jgi:hypothetical protein